MRPNNKYIIIPMIGVRHLFAKYFFIFIYKNEVGSFQFSFLFCICNNKPTIGRIYNFSQVGNSVLRFFDKYQQNFLFFSTTPFVNYFLPSIELRYNNFNLCWHYLQWTFNYLLIKLNVNSLRTILSIWIGFWKFKKMSINQRPQSHSWFELNTFILFFLLLFLEIMCGVDYAWKNNCWGESR
jgi:hypothetical protein